MRLRSIAAAFALTWLGCGAEAAAPISPEALRVLFIGNSHTAVHDPPAIVAAFARATGRELAAEVVAIGGASLGDHLADGEAVRRIRDRRWDVVVLQQGASALPESREALIRDARAFEGPIREAGGVPALYAVWPARDRPGDFESSAESYRLAAEAVGGLLMPGGRAWLEAWAADPALELYAIDGVHARTEGAYLAALVIYAELFGANPIGLPARLTIESSTQPSIVLSDATARRLQEAASRALRLAADRSS